LPQSFALANAAQRILLRDMPVVPLWYTVSVAGRSAAVSHVALTWNGLPDYEHIVKV
jgi:oligopeptide transport system substrate-binding protein